MFPNVSPKLMNTAPEFASGSRFPGSGDRIQASTSGYWPVAVLHTLPTSLMCRSAGIWRLASHTVSRRSSVFRTVSFTNPFTLITSPKPVVAKLRQAAEMLTRGDAHSDQCYAVCSQAGKPYHPSLWQSQPSAVSTCRRYGFTIRGVPAANLIHLQGRTHLARHGPARQCRLSIHTSHPNSRATRGLESQRAALTRQPATPVADALPP